jgi:hypothetical protein
VKALPSRSIGGGEQPEQERGIVRHTKVPGGGVGPSTAEAVHARSFGLNGAASTQGAAAPLDSSNNPPADMKR